MTLEELKKLAGVGSYANAGQWTAYEGSNISITGTEKREIEKKHKIEPGTQEWFKLWFARPYLTGEKPHEDCGR